VKRILLLAAISMSGISIYPQEVNSFQTSDGETLYFTRQGEGRAIVLLYGGPGLNAKLMRHWSDTLSDQFECILFDQRGTGLSEKVKINKGSINLKRAVEDLEDLRKHLNLEKMTLCGFSWGGALSQAYAANHPDNTEKIVLVSSMGPDMSLYPAFVDNIAMRRYPNELDPEGFWRNHPNKVDGQVKRIILDFLPYFFNHKLGYDVLVKLIQSDSFHQQTALLMNDDLFKNYDLNKTLPNYHGDCIIIKPRQDVIPAESAFKIKELLPQTEILNIEQCGHFPDLEKPEEFFKKLRVALN